MEKIGSYDARRNFEAWLFAIARNLAIDYLRRRRAISLDELDDSGQARMDRLTAGGRDALEQLLDLERAALLAATIAELPAIHREVLTLAVRRGNEAGANRGSCRNTAFDSQEPVASRSREPAQPDRGGKGPMTEHESVRAMLALAAAGALGPEEVRRIEQHAQGCELCRRDLETWAVYTQGLGKLPQPSAPEGLVQRTQARILQERTEAAAGDATSCSWRRW